MEKGKRGSDSGSSYTIRKDEKEKKHPSFQEPFTSSSNMSLGREAGEENQSCSVRRDEEGTRARRGKRRRRRTRTKTGMKIVTKKR